MDRIPSLSSRMAATGSRTQSSGRHSHSTFQHFACPRRGPQVTIVVDLPAVVEKSVENVCAPTSAETATFQPATLAESLPMRIAEVIPHVWGHEHRQVFDSSH